MKLKSIEIIINRLIIYCIVYETVHYTIIYPRYYILILNIFKNDDKE